MLKISQGLKIAKASILAIEVQKECVIIETGARSYVISVSQHCEVISGLLYSTHAVNLTVSGIFYADLIQKLELL